MKIRFNTFAVLLGLLSAALYRCSPGQPAPRSGMFRDTVTIDIRGDIAPYVKFKNKYYCFFERDNYPYSGRASTDFYVISPDGEIEYKAAAPEEMELSFYYDLYVRNDSILLKNYYSCESFYFDDSELKWKQIPESDDVVYEDDRFQVNFLDFGEWGGTVWFRDKQTAMDYELNAARPPAITKLEGVYYVSTPQRVLKIEDPLKLKPCDAGNSYDSVKQRQYAHGSLSLQGAEVIYCYKDSVEYFFDGWRIDFYIATSWVRNDELFHVYVDPGKDSVYLAVIDEGELIPVEPLYGQINLYKRRHTYRCQSPVDGSRILNFHTDRKDFFGFMELWDDNVGVTYFNNIYSEKKFGTEASDSLFKELFDYALSNLGNLFLQEADSIERKIGATDFTQLHQMRISYYYPNENNYDLETPRIYQKIEDDLLRVHSKYYYEAHTGSVKVVEFNWIEMAPQEYPNIDPEEDGRRIGIFRDKLNFLENHIREKAGQANETGSWETQEGVTIKLSKGNLKEYKRITLVLYKD